MGKSTANVKKDCIDLTQIRRAIDLFILLQKLAGTLVFRRARSAPGLQDATFSPVKGPGIPPAVIRLPKPEGIYRLSFNNLIELYALRTLRT